MGLSLERKYFASIALLAFSAIILTCVAKAGDNPGGKKTNLEKTDGQVRVILLRVQNTATTNGLQQFVVTYGVEAPLKSAFSDLSFSAKDELTLVVYGQPINHHHESCGSAMGSEDLPRQNELTKPVIAEGKAMLAEDITYSGLFVGAMKIDFKIQFSWRGEPMRFEFKDVPVK